MDGTSGQPAATPPLSHADIRTIIIGVLIAMFLAALDQTIIATALPTIGRELGGMADIAWVVTAYLVASTSVTPLYGKLSDIHGRRVMLLIAVALFMAGSVACALAPTMLWLIIARALQGLGGGGLLATAQTIIADIVSPRERGRYQGLIASVFASSSLAGPVLGGFFAEYLHWSLVFWINLPIGLAALASTNSSLKRLPLHQRPHELDVLGAALMTSGTVSFLLALSWGGLRYHWLSGQILGLFGLAIALWSGFAVRINVAAEPFIPLSVLRNKVVLYGTLSACFAMGTFVGLSIYVPMYFEAVSGLSAGVSGLALIPLMGGTVIGATLSGRTMTRVAHYKRMPMAGLSLAVASMGLMALFAGSMPVIPIAILLAIVSLGLGTVFPVSTVSVQNAVSAHDLGTATGVANFARQLGGALIVAVFGAILLTGTAALTGHELSFEALTHATPGTPAIATVFRLIFAVAGLCLALSLLALIRMKELPLRSSAHRQVPDAESAAAE